MGTLLSALEFVDLGLEAFEFCSFGLGWIGCQLLGGTSFSLDPLGLALLGLTRFDL